LAPKHQFCVLPRKFEPGVEPVPSRAFRTGILEPGQSCAVRCRPDFHAIPEGQDFVFICTEGILHVPKGRCIPIDAMGSMPALSRQSFKLELVGVLGDFGLPQRGILVDFLASRLGTTAKRLEVVLTFNEDSLHVYGECSDTEVSDLLVESIVQRMYDLAVDNDPLWPLYPFAVTSASYDGPVFLSNPVMCALPALAELTFEPTPDVRGCHSATLPLFSACTVQCVSGYVSIGGDNTFGCYQTLQYPTMICQLPKVLAAATKPPPSAVVCNSEGLCVFDHTTSTCGQYARPGEKLDCY
jgi:hypothetical protein